MVFHQQNFLMEQIFRLIFIQIVIGQKNPFGRLLAIDK